LFVSGEAGNWFTLTSACVRVKVLVVRALLVLLALASTIGVVIPGIVSRATAFAQTFTLTSLHVVIGKWASTLVAVGLILDNGKYDSCWCVFACIINIYL
jgi:hypothetical protein